MYCAVRPFDLPIDSSPDMILDKVYPDTERPHTTPRGSPLFPSRFTSSDPDSSHCDTRSPWSESP